MVKSVGSLIVGIIYLIVAIVIAAINKKITIGTIALCILGGVCIFNALRS